MRIILVFVFMSIVTYCYSQIKLQCSFNRYSSLEKKDIELATKFVVEYVNKDLVVYMTISDVDYFIPIAKTVEQENHTIFFSKLDESFFRVNYNPKNKQEIESIVWQDVWGNLRYTFYNLYIKCDIMQGQNCFHTTLKLERL